MHVKKVKSEQETQHGMQLITVLLYAIYNT